MRGRSVEVVQWLTSGDPENNPTPTDLSLIRSIVVQPPTGVQGEPREWLRNEHDVRPLEAIESGLKISEAPSGIFGFVYSLNMAFYRELVSLNRRHTLRRDFELQ